MKTFHFPFRRLTTSLKNLDRFCYLDTRNHPKIGDTHSHSVLAPVFGEKTLVNWYTQKKNRQKKNDLIACASAPSPFFHVFCRMRSWFPSFLPSILLFLSRCLDVDAVRFALRGAGREEGRKQKKWL